MNVYCRDLGQMDYKACWDLQQTLFDALTAGKTNRTAAPESATPSSEEAGTILLVEQNAQAALSVADRGYVLETGKIVTTGTGAELLASPAIKKAYLGG